jgi:ketosteroid isomerase-like protein
VWEDRRRLIRTTGGCDTFTANAKLISRAGTRVSRTTLATAGDWLALQRLSFTGPPEGPRHEIEALDLIEVDAEGRVVALIDFDPDDRRAASAEILERWARSDAARCIPASVFETYRAINDHDLDRVRATLHDDFVYPTTAVPGSAGSSGSTTTSPRFDHCSRDARLLYRRPVLHRCGEARLPRHRDVRHARRGREFESVFARLLVYRDGRIGAVEHFELEHLDVARAPSRSCARAVSVGIVRRQRQAEHHEDRHRPCDGVVRNDARRSDEPTVAEVLRSHLVDRNVAGDPQEAGGRE